MVTVIIVLSSAVLVAGERFRLALAAYVVFTAATLALAFPHHASVTGILLFTLMSVAKMIVGPAALLYLVRRYAMPTDLAGSFTLVWRSLFAIAAMAAGHFVAQIPTFHAIPGAGTVFYTIFASIAIVLFHRNLIAHIIGLLTLGSSITLAGALFAPGLPGAVELADSFDILLATVVGLAVARALVSYDPHLDVRSLRELRG